MFKRHILFLLISLLLAFNSVTAFADTLPKGITYEEKTFDIDVKKVDAKIVTVDLNDSEIVLSTKNVGTGIAQKSELNKVVTEEKPLAIINGSLLDEKNPLGHFYSNGEFIYSSSGLTSMGIDEKGHVFFGKPMIFSRVFTTDNLNKRALSWTIRDINTIDQTGEQSILYTPYHGATVNITSSGWVASVEENVVKSFFRVEAGRQVNIPPKGYLLYFSDKFANTTYFINPEIGRTLSIQHTSVKTDTEDFLLEGTSQILSGTYRLIKSKKINVEKPLPNVVTDSAAVIARSATGCLADGRIVFAYSPLANIDEMCQIMLNLGCIDAISLNSGTNCAMYVNGNYVTLPASQVSTVIIIKKAPPAPAATTTPAPVTPAAAAAAPSTPPVSLTIAP